MYIKWNVTGIIAFVILGGAIYMWGPGFSSLGRSVISGLLYGAVFFASFVAIRRK
ncbi:MAG: hypothetical protein IKP06_06225 [Elusimicrobiaceae bacterium]|nr:hypothetical protein [Elusimicrobiaceae bacterium]